MDLSTIKRKLDTGQYQEPWQYVDDIWLMFNNAWLYNRKTSRVYKYCSKLAEVFEQEIDPVMQSLGYCCGRKVRWGLEVEIRNYCQSMPYFKHLLSFLSIDTRDGQLAVTILSDSCEPACGSELICPWS